jgi:uncharacterized transporter YbjL
MNIISTFAGGAAGALTGLLSGGPLGAALGAVSGAVSNSNSPSGGVNIAPNTDPTIAAQQNANQQYEFDNFLLMEQEMNHQLAMQQQSQAFNDVEDEKTEQMRETNTLREVAMKQREADDKIVKEFIKTAGGE